MQTLKTTLLVVFMLIAVYGAYMIISKPPAKPPAEVSQLTAEDLKAPDIGIGKTVSPDELVFGSAADVSNERDNETDTGNDFNPDELDSSLDINIDGLDGGLTVPESEKPNELDSGSDSGTPVTTPNGSDQQQTGDTERWHEKNGCHGVKCAMATIQTFNEAPRSSRERSKPNVPPWRVCARF